MKKKVIIIGCAGAGKSYFARQLQEISGLPLYYLDCIFWKENWTHLSREELSKEVAMIMAQPEWIIDGNYENTLEARLQKAEAVYFLDIDEKICLESEAARRGTKRPDLPEFLEEKEDPEFIEFIKAFKTDSRPYILELLEKYKDKEIHVFRTREEKEAYLEELKKELQ